MPVPQGQITSSQGWTTPAEPPLPKEPTEVEEKEEVAEEAIDKKAKKK